jgi:hypothetical protein
MMMKKLFLYGGYVNHFNTKIIVQQEGQPSLRLKPKADDLANAGTMR